MPSMQIHRGDEGEFRATAPIALHHPRLDVQFLTSAVAMPTVQNRAILEDDWDLLTVLEDVSLQRAVFFRAHLREEKGVGMYLEGHQLSLRALGSRIMIPAAAVPAATGSEAAP